MTALRSLFVKSHPFGEKKKKKDNKERQKLRWFSREEWDKNFSETPLLGVRMFWDESIIYFIGYQFIAAGIHSKFISLQTMASPYMLKHKVDVKREQPTPELLFGLAWEIRIGSRNPGQVASMDKMNYILDNKALINSQEML